MKVRGCGVESLIGRCKHGAGVIRQGSLIGPLVWGNEPPHAATSPIKLIEGLGKEKA